jgi:FtsP/CotA-like multicopper oxidase with cupredoxin domain
MNPRSDQFPTDIAGLPDAVAPTQIELADGDRFDLRICPMAKRLGEAKFRMLAYNGSIPGPTLRVQQGSELVIHAVNDGDMEATIHWHGLRLENRYDGTAHTQAPMPVGGSFTYRLTFPDAGVYWYHPHIREDYGQEMGLYGNIVVVPTDPEYWPPVNREVTLALDDVLIIDGQIAPFSRSESSYTAMGRFGNVLLANGDPDFVFTARHNEVVRLFLTDTANTRVFNVGVRGARMKRVGGDSGHYEQEEFVDSVIIAPSERVVVDVLFDQVGEVVLEHRTPGRTYPVARILVSEEAAIPQLSRSFETLRTNADMQAERAGIARELEREPDKQLALVAEMDMGEPAVPAGATLVYYCPMHAEVIRDEPGKCPVCGMKLMARAAEPEGHHHHPSGDGHQEGGHSAATQSQDFPAGIEWEDDMVEVNRMTTPANMRWKLIDRTSGAVGMAIDWRFRVGDRVKIRILNEMDSDHPMHHPFHVHGAGRFLILARDGVVEPNLVWKDTVLVPTGQTVDILLEVTNPGLWMAHCHIAEHHESGMMFNFRVDP